MLCRYERKAIVSPVKDKPKAKPKGKVAAGARKASVGPPSKSGRREMPSPPGRATPRHGAAHPSDAGEGGEPRSTRKAASVRARGDGPASRAEKTEEATKTTTESGDDGPQREEGDDEIVEAAGEVVEEDVKVDDIPKAAPARGGALARLDPMQQYLREVQRHTLLTPQEEHDLAVKYVGSGDVAAAARLVTANLRLVVKLAYEYRRAYKNIMDLVQEGNIGLMQAVKRYDPYRGVKLSSYAAWWIRAYILRFILNNWRLVKLGTTQAQRKLFFNLNKEKARLSAMGIEPSSAEIARRLGVEEQEVTDMDRRLSSGEMSLDAPVGDTEGRPVSRLEMMPTQMSGPDTAVAEGEIQQMVKAKLADFRTTLKGKDIQIFDDRLVAEDPLTLQELGDRFGISRERVRQLEARLTGRLREFLKSELGDAVAS
jgi:RNA polymerase sigma-32 factor